AQIDLGDVETIARGFLEDDKTKLAWNLPRALLAKDLVKLLLNMLVIAAQAIPRGGRISVDPLGALDHVGFKVSAAGVTAKIPPALPPLLAGKSGSESVDAHRIQPFYTGLLARACGVQATVTMQGDTVVVAAE
ncbi:MAG TPA: histidine phosphotransferase family protein, partial [Pseudolabrys sp.]|nr:histidine phosphotransferase family protein [Pseudolabrys sp.]